MCCEILAAMRIYNNNEQRIHFTQVARLRRHRRVTQLLGRCALQCWLLLPIINPDQRLVK